MTREKMNALINAIKTIRDKATDETALECVGIYPEWKSGAIYDRDMIVKYRESLYRCVTGHTAQDDWKPDETKSLWRKISVEEFPEWVQPLDAEDAYKMGDKVSHNGKHWENTIHENVWEPGVYGWDVIE